VDALLALLLAPQRTPAEEARLKALLLLLSQSQGSQPGLPAAQQPGAADAATTTWQVVWTEQPLFWRGLAPLLGASGGGAGDQAFCTAAGTVASSVSAGPLRLTASGSFTPARESGAWGDKPVFTAALSGGELALGPLRLPLPLLRGGGAWTLVFADARLRVFRSPDAGLAAQLPAHLLPTVAPAPAEAA
jgi:hypothetical protein